MISAMMMVEMMISSMRKRPSWRFALSTIPETSSSDCARWEYTVTSGHWEIAPATVSAGSAARARVSMTALTWGGARAGKPVTGPGGAFKQERLHLPDVLRLGAARGATGAPTARPRPARQIELLRVADREKAWASRRSNPPCRVSPTTS